MKTLFRIAVILLVSIGGQQLRAYGQSPPSTFLQNQRLLNANQKAQSHASG